MTILIKIIAYSYQGNSQNMNYNEIMQNINKAKYVKYNTPESSELEYLISIIVRTHVNNIKKIKYDVDYLIYPERKTYIKEEIKKEIKSLKSQLKNLQSEYYPKIKNFLISLEYDSFNPNERFIGYQYYYKNLYSYNTIINEGFNRFPCYIECRVQCNIPQTTYTKGYPL